MAESIAKLYDKGIKCYYPIINGELTFICYFPNFLKDQEKIDLQKWLEMKDYKEGKSITGKEIPRMQLWFQENKKCPVCMIEFNEYGLAKTLTTIFD